MQNTDDNSSRNKQWWLIVAIVCLMGPLFSTVISATSRTAITPTTLESLRTSAEIVDFLSPKVRTALISMILGNIVFVIGIILLACWWFQMRKQFLKSMAAHSDIIPCSSTKQSCLRLVIGAFVASCCSILYWPFGLVAISCGHLARFACRFGSSYIPKSIALVALIWAYGYLIGFVIMPLFAHNIFNRQLDIPPELDKHDIEIVLAKTDLPAGTVLKSEHLLIVTSGVNHISGSYIDASAYEMVLGRKLIFEVRGRDPILWYDLENCNAPEYLPEPKPVENEIKSGAVMGRRLLERGFSPD